MVIYTLAYNDIKLYGFGTTSVRTFTKKKDAIQVMKEEYLKKCEEFRIAEREKEKNYTDNYAYIEFMYYWDIFETEI